MSSLETDYNKLEKGYRINEDVYTFAGYTVEYMEEK